MLNYKTELMTTVSWHELIDAVRRAAEQVPEGQCSMFDAERLACAARLVREKAAPRAQAAHQQAAGG